jgi:hypothetical protein
MKQDVNDDKVKWSPCIDGACVYSKMVGVFPLFCSVVTYTIETAASVRQVRIFVGPHNCAVSDVLWVLVRRSSHKYVYCYGTVYVVSVITMTV